MAPDPNDNLKRLLIAHVPQPDPVEELEKLKVEFQYANDNIAVQESVIVRLSSEALVHAPVVAVNNTISPERFETGDRVLVTDQHHQHAGRVGRIVRPVDKNGKVRVAFYGLKEKPFFRIGTPDHATAQVKLLGKNDGTNIVVSLENKNVEVWGSPEFAHASVGDTAKLNIQTHQVMEVMPAKPVMYLPPETDWNDIGGQVRAKAELIEAIEWPFKHPEIFEFYKKKTPGGILLYGPPGCGKTLLGKAAATALARIHGRESVASGWNYIKGGEILNMWVGQNEAETRAIFTRMRRHYEKYKYPAVTFVDEADALLQRSGGTAINNEAWRDTLVAAWLSEMDGMDPQQGILILASNREHALDGAFREGRIDRRIRISRPSVGNGAEEIFRIHLRDVPLIYTHQEEVIARTLESLSLDVKTLCRIHHGSETKIMTLKDVLSGAMIANVVELAKSEAMKRDVAQGTRTGVSLPDFLRAVRTTYLQHVDQNHDYDILDFCGSRGWDAKAFKIEKLFNRE